MRHLKVNVRIGDEEYDVEVPQVESTREFVDLLCDGDEEKAVSALNSFVKHAAVANGRSRVVRVLDSKDSSNEDVENAIVDHKRLARSYKPGRKGRTSAYGATFAARNIFSKKVGALKARNEKIGQARLDALWEEAVAEAEEKAKQPKQPRKAKKVKAA